MKGVTLEPGQVVILELDQSLVYVEDVQDMFCLVVCLPEQPAARKDDRGFFTPGAVRGKRISPFASAVKVVPVAELSDRNKNFIGEFEKMRTVHGLGHVDRTPDEQKAFDLQMNPPDKAAEKAARKEAKAAEKAARKSSKPGPRYLQRCTACDQQPGHPNHGTGEGQHAFEAPAPPVTPPIVCMACDEPEGADAHTRSKEDGGHKFIPNGKVRAPKPPREPREAKAEREPKPPREKKAKPGMVPPTQKYRWVQNDASLAALIAGNGKFSASNSGGAMIETIKVAGEAGIDVMTLMLQHPRPLERLQLAFGQLLGAGLLEAVR